MAKKKLNKAIRLKSQKATVNIGLLLGITMLAFLARWDFAAEIIEDLTGWPAGDIQYYADLVYGFALAAVLLYLAWLVVGNVPLAIMLALAGLSVAFLTFIKIEKEE